MKLLTANFSQYNRFHLNPKLKQFTLETNKSIIVIAGDNGSGKSSLCQTLFPWPLDKANIDEKGSVTRTWLHMGVVYTDTYADGLYSFSKENVELNLSGGLRIQESLFTEHFGIDMQAVKLLSGEQRFTTMTGKQRQYWISRIDQFQLEKLETVVKQLKDEKKEREVLLKYQNSQLGKYVTEVDSDVLLKQQSQYGKQLDALLKARFPAVANVNFTDICREIQEYRKQITGWQKTIRTMPARIRTLNVDDAKADVARLTATRSSTAEAIMALSCDAISIEGIPSVETCQTVIQQCQAQQRDVPAEYAYPHLHQQYLYSSAELMQLFEVLGETIDASALDIERVESTILQVTGELRTTLADRTALHHLCVQIQDDLKHPLSCPKCTHSFGIHGDEAQLIGYQETLERLDRRADAHRATLETLTATLTQGNTWKAAKARLTAVLTQWSPNYCAAIVEHLPNVTKCVRTLASIVAYLSQAVDNSELNVNQRKYEEYYRLHQSFNSQQYHKNQLLQSELDAQMVAIDIALADLASTLQLRRQYDAAIVSRDKGFSTLEQLTQTIEVGLQGLAISGLDKAVSSSILELRAALASVDHQLSMYDANKAHHAAISLAITEQQDGLVLVNQALAALDGKRGFIGHLYKERVKQHVIALNATLAALWNYDLSIDVPPDAMTFKFPLMVEGKYREDVSQGSKGMQEVIDLAFVLLVREYCHLSHIPLILDEFGSALDAVHLDKAYQYLMEYSVEQLAMVSHLTELMHLFDDSMADYVVLSTNHLQTHALPPGSNDCLILG